MKKLTTINLPGLMVAVLVGEAIYNLITKISYDEYDFNITLDDFIENHFELMEQLEFEDDDTQYKRGKQNGRNTQNKK